MAVNSDKAETKRGRVRRLVIDPMIADGFVLKRKTGETADALQRRERDHVAQMADALSYMSDNGLRRMRECLVSKGEGAHRRYWPVRATVIGWAETYEPRPLGDTPYIASWFRSRAGEAAWKDGRLMAEYEFIKKKKRPPNSDQDCRFILSEAHRINDQAMRIEDKISRGAFVDPTDMGWIRRYRAELANVERLVSEGIDHRAEGVAVS